ncbi:MAG: ABC transporter ATP-binding protein [Flavobacteriaceae bacterium]|jgi:ABC-2 type transport system ATP-binding protein
MISIENLTKTYENKEVLNIDQLSIKKGERFGLVGNNGAGKTTLFNLILDLVKPNTGQVLNNNVPVHQSEDWKKHTAAFIDEGFLIGYLTPEEYFYFVGELRGLNESQVDSWLEEFEVFFNGEVLGQKKYIRNLSKGNQKKVGLVSAFLGNPQCVILDEPFANLDPSSQIRFKEIVKKQIENRTTTFLISSHDLNHVTEVCERIVLLEKGLPIKDLTTDSDTFTQLESYFKV